MHSICSFSEEQTRVAQHENSTPGLASSSELLGKMLMLFVHIRTRGGGETRVLNGYSVEKCFSPCEFVLKPPQPEAGRSRSFET
jgi:hypothetical protein